MLAGLPKSGPDYRSRLARQERLLGRSQLRSGQIRKVTALGVGGFVLADSSSGLVQGLVLTQDFPARHVDDHVSISLLGVRTGLAEDLVFPNVPHV